MNTPPEGFHSARVSPRNTGDEIASTYFDLATSPHLDRQTTSLPRQQFLTHDNYDYATRGGGIRVSLACIPCRNRHVKCGAETPSCSRCLQDDKSCFYAKSRRGMRDRSAPRNRASSIKEARTASAASTPNVFDSPSPGYSATVSADYNRLSSASASPSTSSARPNNNAMSPQQLLDSYYEFFHKAHPYAMPKHFLLPRLESEPIAFACLFPVIQYIGSLYSTDVPSSEQRSLALRILDSPNLPPNGFTVQALLLAAIAVHSEDRAEKARAMLDRAIYLALEIKMHSRTFANTELDPVVAESWRRTFWGLYITDASFASIKRSTSFFLHTLENDVELPCEQVDYEGGTIPHPRTMTEYEARDFDQDETIFSSFTYLIDLSRISASLLGIETTSKDDVEPIIVNADAMLVNWKLHLPKEKQGVVDRSNEVDELLFQAHNLLNLLTISIHRPFSRLVLSNTEKSSSYAINTTSQNPTSKEDHSYWFHTRKTLEAAESATNLYALPIPILQHSPIGIHGIASSTLANISACAYIVSGSDWFRTRDRIRLGLGELKKFGEVWAASRRIDSQVKEIARNAFSSQRRVQGADLSLTGGESSSSASTFDFQLLDDQQQQRSTRFDDPSVIQYSNFVEGAQGLAPLHRSTM